MTSRCRTSKRKPLHSLSARDVDGRVGLAEDEPGPTAAITRWMSERIAAWASADGRRCEPPCVIRATFAPLGWL